MDPGLVQQPTIFLEDFLTKYGPAMQAFGFFGWVLMGLASIVIAVAAVMLVAPLRSLAGDYRRYVDFVAGAETGSMPSEASPPAEEALEDEAEVEA